MHHQQRHQHTQQEQHQHRVLSELDVSRAEPDVDATGAAPAERVVVVQEVAAGTEA